MPTTEPITLPWCLVLHLYQTLGLKPEQFGTITALLEDYNQRKDQSNQDLVAKLNADDYSMVEAVMPGFINLKLSGAFL